MRNCAVVGAAVGATKSEVTFRAFKQRGQSRNSGIVGKGLDNGPRGTSETTNWYKRLLSASAVHRLVPSNCVDTHSNLFLACTFSTHVYHVHILYCIRFDFSHVSLAGVFDPCTLLRRYEFNARTLPLGDILSHLNAPKRLDYFSLDIEGAELMV